MADRVTDALLFGGVAWYLQSKYGGHMALLGLAVLASSSIITYERAKAELLGFEARGGLMERAERVILLCFGLLFSFLFAPGAVGHARPHAWSPRSSASSRSGSRRPPPAACPNGRPNGGPGGRRGARRARRCGRGGGPTAVAARRKRMPEGGPEFGLAGYKLASFAAQALPGSVTAPDRVAAWAPGSARR